MRPCLSMTDSKTPAIDCAKATKMLAKGASVRQIAQHFGVTTQAVYYRIAMGQIERPAA